MGKVRKIKDILMLQGVVVLYTVSSVMSKAASGSRDSLARFLFFFGMEAVFLGIYALLWQQMIKRFELSVAYASRSMAVVWSMIWAAVFFHDTITARNILGVLLIVAGTLIIDLKDAGSAKEGADG